MDRSELRRLAQEKLDNGTPFILDPEAVIDMIDAIEEDIEAAYQEGHEEGYEQGTTDATDYS